MLTQLENFALKTNVIQKIAFFLNIGYQAYIVYVFQKETPNCKKQNSIVLCVSNLRLVIFKLA